MMYFKKLVNRMISTGLCLALVSEVSSSELDNLSSSCKSAGLSILSGNVGSCTNLIGLTGIITASGSIVDPLNSWLEGACSKTECSSTEISNATSTIESGCQQDIDDGNSVANALYDFIPQYDTFRSYLCDVYTSNNTLCVSSVLWAVQNATGINITLSDITSALQGGDQSSLTSILDSGAYCTDCGKTLYNMAVNITSNNTFSTTVSSVKSDLSSTCGSSFVDGGKPSSVSEGSSFSSGAALPGSNVPKHVVIFGLFMALTAIYV